jgi:hypothetical protein
MKFIFTLVPVLLLCSAAVGQTSLGDGEGLDASTSSFGRINAQKQLPNGVRNSEIRNSNLLRGGGLNDGLGRQDDAGFRLIQDASEESNEAYQDTLYNSPWYWNNWSKQSAQFLKHGDRSYFNPDFIDNWSTSPQQMSDGRAIRSYTHEWNANDAQKLGGEGEITGGDNWSALQQDQYRLGQVLGTGYQTPTHDASPMPVGNYQNQSTTGYLAAAPLSGVSVETTEKPTNALGFSAWDAARVEQDKEQGLGTDKLVQAWRTDEARLEYGTLENRVAVPDQYINLLDKISTRAQQIVDQDGLEDTTLGWLDTQYAQLQDELIGLEEEEIEDGVSEEASVDPEIADEEITGTLRHGESINVLSGVDDSRFNEVVRLGETALAKGEYFLAQKRFTQALRFIPGHPLATAGLGHANIGAGLYLSASHVLQSLLSFQPEMIDVLYGPHLLPPRIELVRAAIAVQNRLDSERDGNTYAFLLAYIGHQIDDEEMVNTGIAELEKHGKKGDAFVELLKALWSANNDDVNAEPVLQTE